MSVLDEISTWAGVLVRVSNRSRLVDLRREDSPEGWGLTGSCRAEANRLPHPTTSAAAPAHVEPPQAGAPAALTCSTCTIGDVICRAFQLQPNEPGCLHWIDRDRGIKGGEM